MTNNATRPPEPARNSVDDDRADGSRMSFGDHLDELRKYVIRSLIGIALVTVFTLIYGREILEIVLAPLHVALAANNLPPSVQVLAPTGAFLAYLKLSILSGILLAMPWVLLQMWAFVSSGLYDHERRFVRCLVPASVFLFAIGVAFLYYAVLPIVLNFFIGFNRGFDVTPPAQSTFQNMLLGTDADRHVAETPQEPSRIPLLTMDPTTPETGEVWVNTQTKRLTIQASDGLLSIPLEVGSSPSAMSSQFALDFYVSFVLMLALAFGLTFEMPIVVFFLAWSRLVPTATMAKGRRYVLLATVFVAALLTPPDVISQLLLAIPMYLLFELGLLVARTTERKTEET